MTTYCCFPFCLTWCRVCFLFFLGPTRVAQYHMLGYRLWSSIIQQRSAIIGWQRDISTCKANISKVCGKKQKYNRYCHVCKIHTLRPQILIYYSQLSLCWFYVLNIWAMPKFIPYILLWYKIYNNDFDYCRHARKYVTFLVIANSLLCKWHTLIFYKERFARSRYSIFRHDVALVTMRFHYVTYQNMFWSSSYHVTHDVAKIEH
jgi:hypothetical protein